MKLRKIISLILIILLTATFFGGCQKKQKVHKTESNTLAYWMPLDAATAVTVSNFGETPFAKELTKRTGVTVDYIHPAKNNASEEFNILLASNNLPDIIEYRWMGYLGGADKAVEDGFIVPLNDIIEKKAPNLYGFLKLNPEIDKAVRTNGGNYIGFPAIAGDPSLTVAAGLVIRKDWLDDVGLEVPETIDEWEKVLTAFRDKKNSPTPLSFVYSDFEYGVFVGAYGIGNGIYLDNGTVKFGPLEPGYKEFLTKMNDWYKKGLLDKNLFSVDSQTVSSNVTSGVCGASVGAIGGGIGKWMTNAPEGFDLVAAPYPVLEKGQIPQFGHKTSQVYSQSIAITTDCRDIDAAMKLLDYGYSEEGRMLFNFGIEGESYTMVEGYPTYTDMITNDKSGLSMQTMLARYTRAANGAMGSIQDKRYMEQYARLPQQKNAWEVWSNTNAEAHVLPTMYPLEEDTEEYSKIVLSIDTYNRDMITKFIMGVVPLSEYDEYVAQLKSRGIDRLIRIHQDAYQRYLER